MYCGLGESAFSGAAHASGVTYLATRNIDGSVCAIMDDDSLACGGSGGLSSESFGGSGEYIQLNCSRKGCCAIDTNNEIHCSAGTPTSGPNATPLIVAGNDSDYCAVYSDGESYCWGNGGFAGSIGGASAQANPSVPVPLAEPVVAYAGGQFTSCWVHLNGTVSCSGNGGGTSNGAGGGGDTPSKIKDVNDSELDNIIAVNGGRGTACGAASNGDLYCWGDAGGQSASAVKIDLEGKAVRMPLDCME